jgi:hypothetical protein
MNKTDIAPLSGAVISAGLSALSFVYNVVALEVLFPVLAGAFITYWIQNRLQAESENRTIKRQNYDLMRERIYGPILQNIDGVIHNLQKVETLKVFQSEDINNIEPLRDHLYSSVPSDIQAEFSDLWDRLQKYGGIRYSVELALNKIVSEEMAKFSKESWDPTTAKPTKVICAPDEVLIRLDLNGAMVANLLLKQSLLLGSSPKDFVQKQTKRWGPILPLKTECYPNYLNMDAYETLYANLHNQIENNMFFIEEKNQRKQLLEQLQQFSEKIRPHVNLS